jgi:hypothetical protein
MHTLSQLSCLFRRKSILCIVASLLLSTLVLLSIDSPNSAYADINFVGLSVHSDDQTNQTNYITVTYKGADGNKRDHVSCQSLPYHSWYDIPISDFIAAGQTISIRYYFSAQCNPSSKFLEASPQVPQNPSYDHCWFNPNATVNGLNWSGCVNPSVHADTTN